MKVTVTTNELVTLTTNELATIAPEDAAPLFTGGFQLIDHADTCPTCLVNPADSGALAEVPGHAGVAAATCPTCEVSSLEWGLVIAMDEVLGEMSAYESLEGALNI